MRGLKLKISCVYFREVRIVPVLSAHTPQKRAHPPLLPYYGGANELMSGSGWHSAKEQAKVCACPVSSPQRSGRGRSGWRVRRLTVYYIEMSFKSHLVRNTEFMPHLHLLSWQINNIFRTEQKLFGLHADEKGFVAASGDVATLHNEGIL